MKKRGDYTDAVDLAHYGPEVRRLMDEAKHCLNCGARLGYLDKNKRRNRGYCSLECYYAKPPKLAYAERVYGKAGKQLLLELLNRHKNVNAVAELLGVRKQALYGWMRRYQIRRVVRWE